MARKVGTPAQAANNTGAAHLLTRDQARRTANIAYASAKNH